MSDKTAAMILKVDGVGLVRTPTISANSLLLTPAIADVDGAALRLHKSLQSINRQTRAGVFEGVVMKGAGACGRSRGVL